MGSGSTGAAALELDRDFVGIESNQTFFNAAQDWINAIYNLNLEPAAIEETTL